MARVLALLAAACIASGGPSLASAPPVDPELAGLAVTLSRLKHNSELDRLETPSWTGWPAARVNDSAPPHRAKPPHPPPDSVPQSTKKSRGSGAARRECMPREAADACECARPPPRRRLLVPPLTRSPPPLADVRSMKVCRLGRVHYLELYYCGVVQPGRPEWAAVLALLLWMSLVFCALTAAADLFFAPAVSNIAAWMKLSEDVAGATLLAFGNGAPDFFTQVAAIAGGEQVDMPLALGEGVGSGLYVSVFCLGCALLAGPKAGVVVPARAFVRDTGVYLVSLLLVLLAARDNAVSGWESAALLGWYGCYVALVMLGARAGGSGGAGGTHALAELEEGSKRDDAAPATPAGSVVKRSLSGGDPSPSHKPEGKDDDDTPSSATPEALPPPGSLLHQLRGWVATYSGWEDPEANRYLRPVTAPIRLVMGLTMADPSAGVVSPLHLLFITLFLPSFLLFVAGRPAWAAPTPSLRWTAACRAALLAGVAATLPPRGLSGAHSRLVSALAFLGGLAWMDTCADEVVGIFQALGHVLGLPEAVLGGTIMCWAASVGDLAATLSVVRRGYLQMAITSSFAGPIFQLLCGLGVSMLFLNVGGAPVPMFLGTELQVMFGFTLAVLTYFVLFVPTWHKGLLNWRFGYAALAAYILFVVVYTALGLEHFT